jgi:hypothetical protein
LIFYRLKSLQRALQAFDDFRRHFVRRRQQVGVVEGVVFKPKDVEIDLVALAAFPVGSGRKRSVSSRSNCRRER